VKQILIRKGKAILEDVPLPVIGSGEILVQVKASCLSIGTELSGVKLSAIPMWKRALNQPENIAKVISTAKTYGIKQAVDNVIEKKNAAYPTGYSSSGVVLKVGNDVKDIKKGDRVACAGSPHAEIIKVTRNLCVPIPNELDFQSASTVTLGAIALQGIRRANPTLGETFVVIGLGVLGQLTVQFLKANGCKVIGLDLNQNRIELAKSLGLDWGINPATDSNDIEHVFRITEGIGCDGAIITAAAQSDELISSAFKMCRKKGRVVLVGDVGLNLKRADFYSKELDFFISTSYGPGRYDVAYEEHGVDYPISYVRWTENRNMSEYLSLLTRSVIKVDTLVSSVYSVTEAPEAYALLNSDKDKHLMVLLTYPEVNELTSIRKQQNKDQPISKGKQKGSIINLAIVGAGGFARGTHLPIIKELHDKVRVRAIVNKTGYSAKTVADQFGADYASTDFNEILNDDKIDAIIIATRHNLHAEMTLQALKAGKHVLVEKPLVVSSDELDMLDQYISSTDPINLPVLLTGFNRRFSPYFIKVKSILEQRTAPFIFNYRMNAGFINKEHWVHGLEGGGRNIGEACHIYDLFTYLSDSVCAELSVHTIDTQNTQYLINDNFCVTLKFTDGSIANLTYTAMGAKSFPKEMAELYYDGKVISLQDYTKMDFHGIAIQPVSTKIQDKGHKNQLISFIDAIHSGKWPIPWWQQLEVSKIALAVESQLYS
jgi:predicted dehydrogenase/threonine dehydrogenase-like Zn-dependent dehydrogenase